VRDRHAEATGLTSLLREPRLYPLAALHTASFGVSVVAGNWIVDLLEDDGHSRRTAGLVGALVLLLGLITRPLGGWLMRSRPPLTRPALVASLAAAAAGLAALALPVPLAALVAAAALAGLASGIPFAAAFAGAQRLRPDAPAAAIGVVNSAATLAILVGTPLIGLTFSLPGEGRIGFGILAACAAAALPATRRRFW
jgi:nitrate/nitrite transporter NarK